MKPNLFYLVGLPGSGKTYWANSVRYNDPNTRIISSDAIRAELWGDENDQRNPDKVFEVMLERTIEALKQRKDVVYDATNLVAKLRKNTLAAIRAKVDCTAHCLFMACCLSECKRRQAERERKVPDEVIDRMVRRFEAPWYNEGWDNIDIIDCGKLQNVEREHWRILGESHDNPHHTASLGMHCVNCAFNIKDLIDNNDLFSSEMKEVIFEAAYQHDLGKYKTKAFSNSKGEPCDIAHYYNHNNVGAYLWLSGDSHEQWSVDNFLFIAVLIQWHMQPFFLRDESGEYRAKFSEWCIKKGFDREFYEAICAIHEADKAAH